MTPTHIFSALDAMLAEAISRNEHYVSGWLTGDPHCLICGATWPDAETWAADQNAAYCPGYATCGLDPVPVARVSVGGA